MMKRLLFTVFNPLITVLYPVTPGLRAGKASRYSGFLRKTPVRTAFARTIQNSTYLTISQVYCLIVVIFR